MTKDKFMAAYRAELLAQYPWASNPEKLSRFMASVWTSITTNKATWNHDGDAVRAAWHTIGGKGKPTLKALCALED
jgi:hypothetical protein